LRLTTTALHLVLGPDILTPASSHTSFEDSSAPTRILEAAVRGRARGIRKTSRTAAHLLVRIHALGAFSGAREDAGHSLERLFRLLDIMVHLTVDILSR
jgi:hypothetical protein